VDDARSEPSPSETNAWPLPSRFLDHLRLETRAATIAYWGGVFLVAASLFVSKLLPCVDYPQHLALADVARRLGDPHSPDHAWFKVNWFTYNGLFHFVVAQLSRVMPIELAGRVVVAASIAILAAAVLALVRVLRRPPSYAALFVPVLFSFSVGWGFVNYALATAIAVVALVFIARVLVRPTIPGVLAIAFTGLLCAFGHVLAMIVLCLTAAAFAPEIAWRRTARAGSRITHLFRATLRSAIALAPLLLGCAFCVRVYIEQYVWDPHMYKDPTLEGTAPPLWQKLVYFGAFATDLNYDHADQVVLLAAFVVMAAAAIVAWRRAAARSRDASESPPLYAPFVLLTIAYFATPMVLVGTHLIFPRLAQGVVLGALFATPSLAGALGARMRKYALAVGVLCGVSTFVHGAIYAYETNDASRVIDELPEGRGATAVLWDTGTFAYRNGALVHLQAYYAARKHGRWAFAFARYLSVPVRFRAYSQPAWPLRGWEFDGSDYNPRCKYARAFDLAIVRAPLDMSTDDSSEYAVRRLVFGKDADKVTRLSHHGEFWAFDTKGLPDDGTN
jgi:hypothetical protein